MWTYPEKTKFLKRTLHSEIYTPTLCICAPECVCTCVYMGVMCAHMHRWDVCACVCVCVYLQSWVSQRARHEESREIYFPFNPQETSEISLTLIKPTPGSWTWWAWWTFVLKGKLGCQTSFFPSSHLLWFPAGDLVSRDMIKVKDISSGMYFA